MSGFIGNRRETTPPHPVTTRDKLPLVYTGMLDSLREVGGIGVIDMHGIVWSQRSEGMGGAKLPGSTVDWLNLVAWGMIEGCGDGTKIRLASGD